VSFPRRLVVLAGGGWVRCGEERDCFTIANGMESSAAAAAAEEVEEEEVGEESSGRSSRMEGSCGGEGVRTQRFEEYFVRMKVSILFSEGMWEGGNWASQYLLLLAFIPRHTNKQK